MRFKIIIGIMVMILLVLPLAIAQADIRSTHIINNNTFLIYGDLVGVPEQDNSSRLLTGTNSGTPTVVTTGQQVGEGAIETEGTASIEGVSFDFNSLSHIYNMTLCGWYALEHVDNAFLASAQATGDSAGFGLRWRTSTLLNLFSDVINIFSTSTVSGGHLNHICVGFNQTGGVLYTDLAINGTIEASGADTLALTDFSQKDTNGNFVIMTRVDNAAFTVDGLGDEIWLANQSFGSDYYKYAYDLGVAGTRIEVFVEPAGTCDCPSVDTDWEISDGSICTLSSACDIGTGKIHVNNGALYVDSGAELYCAGVAVDTTTGNFSVNTFGVGAIAKVGIRR
jgi:hypothetical protein|tara:strand:+ start:8861 stop:9874 length:1014 start_codon:yes stop_codon:yes gene_type:complete